LYATVPDSPGESSTITKLYDWHWRSLLDTVLDLIKIVTRVEIIKLTLSYPMTSYNIMRISGQKWPFQCQPRPFYKWAQTQPSVCTLQVHPPTSFPAFSAHADPKSQGHCWKWHNEAESLTMSYEVIG